MAAEPWTRSLSSTLAPSPILGHCLCLCFSYLSNGRDDNAISWVFVTNKTKYLEWCLYGERSINDSQRPAKLGAWPA